MRALKAAVVVMGVVIIVATGALVVGIVQRVMHPKVADGHGVPGVTVPGVRTAGVAAGAAVLDEPAGTRIAAVVADGDGLAVTLSGGGPDRVLLLDHALHVVGRVSLAR